MRMTRGGTLALIGALVGILLLVGVAVLSGSAAASGPPPAKGTASLTYTKTVHGTATSRPARAPDVLILPSAPVGDWWQLKTIELTAHFGVSKTFRQDAFLFSRFVQNSSGYPGLADPNLDVLAHVGINPGKTGTVMGAGGTGTAPSGVSDWTQFTQPICVNSEIQIVLGSSIAIGNSVDISVQYVSLGSGTTVVMYAHPSLHGGTETFTVGPVPAGTTWFLQNAYGMIQAGTSGQGREVVMHLEPSGQVILKGTDYPVNIKVRNTGGYSERQCGPALNQWGTQVVWGSPIWLSGSQYILVSFTGVSSDSTMYALGFTQVPSS